MLSINVNNSNIRSNTQNIQSNSATNHYLSEKPEESSLEGNLKAVVLHTQEFRTEVLLGTAIIHLKDKHGNTHKARALLDSGSQSNLISKELCQKLNLSTDSISYSITGINSSNTTINKMTETTIYSSTNSFNVKLSFLVLEKITVYLPTVKLDIQNISIPNNIQLADINFHTPGKIDLLLGASIFYDLLCIGQLKINKHSPIIQKTKLGWIITGNLIQTLSTQTQNIQTQNKLICNLSIDTINNQLKQFWEIENIEDKKQLSKEEEECELEFEEKTYRDENNQFNVPLLTKDTITQLGQSYESALNRFQSLERKLQKDPQLKKMYTEFMKEYEELGDMEKLENPTTTYPEFYFPHHGILKVNSVTTKLRVVFDGSAKSSTGILLNECLKVGPTIQADLFTIVLRFRKFNIVLAADIEKMYRRVKIQNEYHNLQKILWRSNPENPISQYKLKTVTYGTASAPYLAIKCLFKIAKEIKATHTGLDYCGPFTIKANKLRNSKLLKIYVCIFVCFSTKAVNLEIVADLTSECFINCLKRFISRRGKPVALYSDNATTFVGANNYLKDMYEIIVNSKNKIQEYLLTESINWKFIPARSPHHGGIWEACVKSFKFHFKRVINNHVYLFENFYTLVTQIEAVLNSRPLTQLSSDPSDLFALTPGHFLIFQPLTTYPEPDLYIENPSRLSTFQYMVQTLQEFWVRWSNEYILQLQQRNKWKIKPKIEIKEGQLVLSKEDNLPPLQWKLGRILKTFPGNDGEIRVISIKTNSGEVRRAITKVAILPLEM